MENCFVNAYWYVTLNSVAITVNFNQSTFVVNEYEGPVTPVLTLSKPSSCCLTIRATLENVTATGKLCMYYSMHTTFYFSIANYIATCWNCDKIIILKVYLCIYMEFVNKWLVSTKI